MGSAADNALRFVRNMVLTRLLAPEAFGVMAIVLSVCSLFNVLTGMGIKESVIQNPRGGERTFLNAAWWLASGRGLTLFLFGLVTAPWIAHFYDAPELTRLLRVAFIGLLAQGAMSAGVFLAYKQMRYAKCVFVIQGGGIIGIVVTLILAFHLRGVWALVIGYATEGIARCILSYLVCPFRPGWKFESENLQAMFRFAGGMFGLPILTLIYNDAAVFAVGKLCSKSDLGIFAMALTLSRIPTMFSGQIVDLLMPAFSEIQLDLERINQGIRKVTTVVILFGLPAVCFMALFATDVLAAVYGQKYLAGGPALILLFVNELISLCSAPIIAVFLAIGQPRLLRRFAVIRAIIILLLVWPAIVYAKLVGAALVPLSAMIAVYGFLLFQLVRLTGLKLSDYFAVLRGGIIASIPIVILGLAMSPFSQNLKPVMRLATALGLVAVLFCALLCLAYRKRTIRHYFWPFAAGTS